MLKRGLVPRQGGTQEVQLNLDNRGWVDVRSGEWRFRTSGVTNITGHLEVALGAIMHFYDAGPQPLALGSTIHIGEQGAVICREMNQDSLLLDGLKVFGDGTFHLGGTSLSRLTHEGSVAIENFGFSSGALAGPGRLTIAKSCHWSGGAMDGSGVTGIGPDADLTIEGPEAKSLRERTLRNAGLADWSGTGMLTGSTATWHNLPGSRFAFRATGALKRFNTALKLVNEGLITRGGTYQEVEFNLENRSRVEVLSGEWRLRASEITNLGHIEVGDQAIVHAWDAGLPLVLGGVVSRFGGTGTAAIDGRIDNHGLIDVMSGTLEFRRGLTSQPRTTIGGPNAGTGFGQLSLQGNVSLGGLLQIVRDPIFAPAPGQQFSVLTATPSLTGQFAAVSGRAAGNGQQFDAVHNPNAATVVVQASSTAAEPLLASLSSPEWKAGQMTLGITGCAGVVVVIESSNDLNAWETVATFTLGDAPAQFVDQAAARHPKRYYRFAAKR